jgi:salicylate hydroxylase
VTATRTAVIAGAGIGGLTAALSLARVGLQVIILEQAERLEETGAGIQLSPNASRVLLDLGLGDQLRAAAVTPTALRVLRARDGHEIVRMPLAQAAERFGAPYWVIHRGDLQAVLLEAVRTSPQVKLVLGTRVDRFAVSADGITVQGVYSLPNAKVPARVDTESSLLIGADGIWSAVRALLGDKTRPRFAGRVAWRALVPTEMAAKPAREPMVNLWLGRRSHLVHYPVAGGRQINVVAITEDHWDAPGWSTRSTPAEVLARYPLGAWSRHARDLIGMPDHWLKWALHERAPLSRWGDGPVTLLGDAAHPVLPFLAQGAALAIEDAAVLAAEITAHRDDVVQGLRAYESRRRGRTTRVQRTARQTGRIYHRGVDAFLRDIGMRMLGGERLLQRYDWIYNWRAT